MHLRYLLPVWWHKAKRGRCVQCDAVLVGERKGRWPYCPNRDCIAYSERTANVSYRRTGGA